MPEISNILMRCALFAGLSADQIDEISRSQRLTTRRYARGSIVAFEEDPCSALGILAEGGIHIQRIFPNGKLITIETFSAGDSFGEALIFSDSSAYPATLVATEETTVLYIPKDTVIDLCTRYPQFLAAFMRSLSNRILLLNRKIKNLSLGTIRQKVANYLLEERRRQASDLLVLPVSRGELADWLGVPRPSLSRELIYMKETGWIDFYHRTVRILNPDEMESALRGD